MRRLKRRAVEASAEPDAEVTRKKRSCGERVLRQSDSPRALRLFNSFTTKLPFASSAELNGLDPRTAGLPFECGLPASIAYDDHLLPAMAAGHYGQAACVMSQSLNSFNKHTMLKVSDLLLVGQLPLSSAFIAFALWL